jgi:branched-chain amino acid transport system substrate-binding protein
MRKTRLLAMVVALSVLFCVGAQAAEKVRLGLITPLTGTLGFGGNEVKNALLMAVEQKKTLFGKPIELVIADAPDSTAAVSEMERLMTRENLPVVFGGYGSALEEAWQKVAAQQKKLNLGLVNWSDKLTAGGNQYYYRYAAPASWLCGYLVEAITNLAPKYLKKTPETLKIVVVNSDLTGYVATPVIENFKAKGYKDITQESYPSDLKDFASILLKIRRSNPDVLVLCQYTSDGMAFRRQMVAMDYEAPITMGCGLIYDQPEFAELGPKAADGALATSFTNPMMNPKVAPGLKEFHDEYVKRYGHVPLTHALIAYAGALVYMDVIESAGSLDVDKIKAKLATVDIPPGKTSAYWGAKFDQTGQNVLAGKPCVVAQWKKGKYTVVWPDDFATDKLDLPLVPFSKR